MPKLNIHVETTEFVEQISLFSQQENQTKSTNHTCTGKPLLWQPGPISRLPLLIPCVILAQENAFNLTNTLKNNWDQAIQTISTCAAPKIKDNLFIVHCKQSIFLQSPTWTICIATIPQITLSHVAFQMIRKTSLGKHGCQKSLEQSCLYMLRIVASIH